MLQAAAHVTLFLRGHLGEGLVLQLVEGDTLAAVKLSEIASCSSNTHPLLDAMEGVEGDGSGSELAVGGIEQRIRGVLMVGDAPLSTLGGTGSSDKIAQLIHPIRSKLLPLHSRRILLLDQIRVAGVLPLCIADGRGCCVEQGCCCGGGNVLAESGEERGAMMGVHRKSIHQLACVLTDLGEWVEGWMLFFGLAAALLALCVSIVSA